MLVGALLDLNNEKKILGVGNASILALKADDGFRCLMSKYCKLKKKSEARRILSAKCSGNDWAIIEDVLENMMDEVPKPCAADGGELHASLLSDAANYVLELFA